MTILTILQLLLPCISILWVSNQSVFNGKLRLTITGGMLMEVVEFVNEIICGAGECGISHP